MFGNIKNRIKNYYGVTNSVGVVTRNYAKAPRFDPYRQVTGITYKAIDKIGQSLSDYEIQVKRGNGDPYETHPLYTLVRRPNPAMSSSDFVHLYAMLFEIYGETFWYKVRGENTRKIKEVYLLAPDRMELRVDEGELVGYVMHKSNGQQVPFLPEEIYHDKRPNPFNEWRGMSVLERAAVYVDTEINIANFTLNYIKNNASPSGIVSLPAMDREAFESFCMQWREGYEGPENAGKTAFIRGNEAKFQAVGATLKDVDAKVIKEMSKDDVLMMLDVPKPLLGMTDDSGFGRSNVETLNYIFASEKLEPMMKRLDRIWEEIGTELTGQPIKVGHVSPVPEDKEFQLQTHEKGVNIWLTVNEVRQEMGLPPLPGGEVLMPQNRPMQETKSEKTVVTVVKKKSESPSERAKRLNTEQEEFRSNLVDTNEVYVKKLKSAISRFTSEQENMVISRINASTKAYEEWLFSIKEESEAMGKLLTPIVIELMEAQGEDVANFITGELLAISPETRGTVESNITKISGLYNEETIKALERTLTEGQTAGESLAKLKRRVEDVYTEAKGYRAERIARTESLKASNMMAEEVYKQNGYSRVQWFTNPGACEFCESFAGQTKTIGGDYAKVGSVITGADGNQLRIEYDNIGTPPLHPNCTCSLVPAE